MLRFLAIFLSALSDKIYVAESAAPSVLLMNRNDHGNRFIPEPSTNDNDMMEKCYLNMTYLNSTLNLSSGQKVEEYVYNGLTCPYAWNPCKDRCLTNQIPQSFQGLWVEPHASTIFGTIYPGLLVITIVSNIFILAVLTKPHMKTPTNVVLMYMAVAQLLVALVPAPFLIFYYTFGYYKVPSTIQPWWCYLAHISATDVLPPVIHNAAIWLTVLLAAQRIIYIRLPVKARSLCTVGKVNWATLAIVVISFLGNASQFLILSKIEVLNYEAYDLDTGVLIGKQQACLHTFSHFMTWIGENRYYMTYLWSRAIIFAFVPSVLLICLTIVLITSLNKAQKRRSRLLIDDRSSRSKDRTSLMLVLIVLIFLAVNLPLGILLMLLVFKNTIPTFMVTDWNGQIVSIVMMVDNLLILATYPLNFAVYCSMSAQFRATFKALFCTKAAVYWNSRHWNLARAGTIEQMPLNTMESGAEGRNTGSLRSCKDPKEQSPHHRHHRSRSQAPKLEQNEENRPALDDVQI